MITTRARPGRGCASPGPHSIFPGDTPGPRWPGTPRGLVIALHVVEKPVEILAGQAGGGALVALHRPRPEVEAERAGGGLDRAPQRPSVPGHQAEQRGAGDLVPQRAAVVLGDQRRQGLGGKAALAPDVPELETGVVVARVLVVDQPDPVAVVDEVAGQQVVVAGNA